MIMIMYERKSVGDVDEEGRLQLTRCPQKIMTTLSRKKEELCKRIKHGFSMEIHGKKERQ